MYNCKLNVPVGDKSYNSITHEKLAWKNNLDKVFGVQQLLQYMKIEVYIWAQQASKNATVALVIHNFLRLDFENFQI